MGLTAIVLGAAAGGGFPQWNCNCDVCRLAWAGDPRVRAAHAGEPRCVRRRQALDAAQRLARSPRANPGRPERCIRASMRGSPIEAVVLTGAEIDQTAGLLSLRERSPFTIMATAATLAAVADNPMFGALAPDVVSRRAITPGRALQAGWRPAKPSCSWCRARCRSISKARIRKPRRKARPMSASRSPTATSGSPMCPARRR